jgi:hypothetical protein
MVANVALIYNKIFINHFESRNMKSILKNYLQAFIALSMLFNLMPSSFAQSTQLSTEYVMTVFVQTDHRYAADASTTVVEVKGGNVKGPNIQGEIVLPGGDWIRTMSSGALRLDAKVMIKTDDGALIQMNYNGVVVGSKEAAEALAKGEVVTDKTFPYFITAPTFQTSSEKYSWLNKIQTIGKMIEVKRGDGSYVKYDIFIIR